MGVSSLGYVVVEAPDTAAWRKFGVDVLGLAEGPAEADGSLRLRVDERPFRIAVEKGSANRFKSSGWEFRDDAALDAAIEALRKSGIEVRAGSAEEASRRCVHRLVHCADPAGNRLELYVGRVYDYAPFSSSKGLTGFVTGDMGMGHVVLPAPQIEQTRAFYQQHLGFGDSDQMWLAMSPNPADPKLGIYFLHAENPRHHSLALMSAPAPSGCAHIMLEARTIDDVGLSLDRCMAAGAHISSSFGKHSNDFMLSFYVQTPGGFDLEFGCGGLQPDWKTWVPTHSLIPDLWGHRWSPPPAAS